MKENSESKSSAPSSGAGGTNLVCPKSFTLSSMTEAEALALLEAKVTHAEKSGFSGTMLLQSYVSVGMLRILLDAARGRDAFRDSLSQLVKLTADTGDYSRLEMYRARVRAKALLGLHESDETNQEAP